MDEREIEQGYANFHRRLNQVLRRRDVKAFKALIAAHPREAGRLTHCLGLNDSLAEIEMFKTILARSPLKDIHHEARRWLRERGVEPPLPRKVGKGLRPRMRRGGRGR